MKHYKICILTLFLNLVLQVSLQGAITNWVNPGIGDWTVPTNWDNGVPGAADDAFIANGGTADVAVLVPNADSVDIRNASTVNIHNQGDLTVNNLIMGDNGGNPNSLGFVDGPFAHFSANLMQVGILKDSTFSVINGGQVTAGNIEVGFAIPSLLKVVNPGSSIIASGSIQLSISDGDGQLQILDGATVVDSTARIAVGTDNPGTAIVDGAGSTWTNNVLLVVGDRGIGNLFIQNNGRVFAPNVVIAEKIDSEGSISISSNGLLSTGSIVGGLGNSKVLTIDGGILQATTGNPNFISNLTLAQFLAGGATIDTQSFTVGIPQVLTGPGNLTKVGTGTLILTGVNSLTGNTTISSGTLQVNTASIPSGNVLNFGSLIFDQGFNGTFSGSISGSGSLTKINNGILTLTGFNTYAGGSNILGGTLIGNTNSIPSGNVLNNATLIFDQTFDGTFAGNMSGIGIFIKQGGGKLQLTGNSGGFTGSSTVTQGELNVNGSLGGLLTINGGAILSGIGFLGDVINNGIISPGNPPFNPIGTLHVNSLVSNASGIYLADIAGTGQSDLIDATSTVLLNGGILNVTAQPGIYLQGTTFTLINANGGLSGQFATHLLPPNVPLLVNYLPNQLILTVLNTVFDTKGLKGNALRVAEYIKNHVTASPDFLKVIAALNTLNIKQKQNALDQLHPAIFEALTLTASDTAYMINSTFVDRLNYLRQGCCVNSCRPCGCGGIWAAGTGNFVHQKKDEGLRSFNTSSGGLALGYDHEVLNSFIAGVGAGYSNSYLKWGNSAGHVDIHGYYLGLYATKCNDCYYFDGSILSFIHHHKVRRHIHFANIHRQARNTHHSYGFNPHLGAGYYWNFCSLEIIPFFDFDYYYVNQDKAHERGAKSLNLRVKSNQSSLVRLETGVKFSKCLIVWGARLEPNVSLSYVFHRLLSGKKYISTFEGVKSHFAVFGSKACFNQFELGLGLTYFIDDKLAVNFRYDAEIGRKREEQEVNLEVNYHF